MAINLLTITKEANGYFTFVLNGDTTNAIKNTRNDLTTVGNYAHFKTANGANLISQQNVLYNNITIVDGGTSLVPISVDDLFSKLISVDFFDWLNEGGGGSGVDRFDELLDTFTYFGKDGQILRVNESELKLETFTMPDVSYLNNFPSPLVAGKMLRVNDSATGYELVSVINVVSQNITEGNTETSPSEDVVFKALELKANASDVHGLRWGYVVATNGGTRNITVDEDYLDVSGSPITNYTINLPTVTEARTIYIAFDSNISNLNIGASGVVDYYPLSVKTYDTWAWTYEPVNNRWVVAGYFSGDLGAQITALPNKSTLGDTDYFAISDGAASSAPKKVTALNLSKYVKPLPVPVPDTQEIPFSNMLTMVGNHTMSGALIIIPNTMGAIIGCGAIQRITADGTNIPDFSAFKLLSTSGSYLNQPGAVNIFGYFFDGTDYNIGVMQNGDFSQEPVFLIENWSNRLISAGYTISSPRKSSYLAFIQTLSDNEIYSLFTEMWFFEGGTSSTNILGFKNAKNLIAHGGLTHGSTGTTGNGSSGYMDTGISPVDIGVSDMHMSIYARNTSANDGYVIGSGTVTPLRYTAVAPRDAIVYSSIGGLDNNATSVNRSGRYIISRNNGTIKVSRNNLLASITGTNYTDLNSRNLLLFALNEDAIGGFSNQEIGFASIGKSLTDSQITILDTALSTLFTALSR